ncbi:MAG: hypothetical protein ACRDTD_23165, partial [Pseudonocardiaceae bacterium]
LRRLTIWLAIALSAPLLVVGAHAADTEPTEPSFGGFRLVKSVPGTPSVPEIRLPDEYAPADDPKTQGASRAEFYSYITGPSNSAVPVTVTWPGEIVKTVIVGKSRATITRDPQNANTIHFKIPVTAKSPAASSNTLEVWSLSPTDPGIFLRIEHYDPDRAVGDYALQSVRPQAAAAVNQLFAAQAILRDSGLAARAASRNHFFALMGFETNNLVHGDYPAHWHFAYYHGPTFAAKAYLPHLLLDEDGRNLRNGQNVTAEGRTSYPVGEPAGLLDPEGKPVAILTVRPDGGLDVQAGATGRLYSIVGDRKENLSRFVTVLRDGEPWLRVSARDNTKAGRLKVDIRTPPSGETSKVEYTYDPLTGVIESISGSGKDVVLKSSGSTPDRGEPPTD